MHQVLAPMRDCITARIPRAELLGLLDTMTPHERQAVTAELAPVASLEPTSAKPLDMVVVAAACALSLAMGTILLVLM